MTTVNARIFVDFSSSGKSGGDPIDVIVDFLMPRDAEIVKNKPPLIEDVAVQRADGADLALQFFRMVAVCGTMPKGGTNQVEIAVYSILALLAMKRGTPRAGAISRKMLTTSTTASAITQLVSSLLPKTVGLRWNRPAEPRDTVLSLRIRCTWGLRGVLPG